jgi:hypothetical protein
VKEPQPCACVSMDPYECAMIRDGRGLPDFEEQERRACECSCHDEAEEDR